MPLILGNCHIVSRKVERFCFRALTHHSDITFKILGLEIPKANCWKLRSKRQAGSNGNKLW